MLACRTLALTGIVLGGLPLDGAGQAQMIQIPLTSKQALARQVVAPPRDFVELCTGVKARRALSWQFEAEHPLGFNTHSHLDGAALSGQSVAAMGAAMSAAKGRLVPNGDHEHCWMWSNPLSVPVKIRVQLGP